MSKVVLRHVTHTLPVKIEYFYDGLIDVYGGFVEIDADDEVHARLLWARGYRLTKDGRPLYDWADYLNYAKGEVPTTA